MKKPTQCVCDLHGSRPVCAFAQTDQDPRCSLSISLLVIELVSEQHESWPDCTDAQADLIPCWSQTHYVGFVVTRLILPWNNYMFYCVTDMKHTLIIDTCNSYRAQVKLKIISKYSTIFYTCRWGNWRLYMRQSCRCTYLLQIKWHDYVPLVDLLQMLIDTVAQLNFD
jgi:hypothetical protein